MSDADSAAYLDERLHGLEEALHNVKGGIAAYSGAMQSTLQRITAAEWHIDKVRSAAAVNSLSCPTTINGAYCSRCHCHTYLTNSCKATSMCDAIRRLIVAGQGQTDRACVYRAN